MAAVKLWWWMRLAWWEHQVRHYDWLASCGKPQDLARREAIRSVRSLQMNRP